MKILFTTFLMGDVDDVDIYVAQPIYDWQQTKHGSWVMENVNDLKYYTSTDPTTLGYRISICGEIPDGPQLTEYLLKYSHLDR